ncbi:MAG: MFS transporter [Proteobacteria bacterium]|nr:MFS transporter [Pseudomonadota bacterium]
MIAAIRKLPRTVWLLGLISLTNDAASDMIYPLVPLYLASVLMAGPKALGIIEGIAEAVSSLLKLFAGVLADRTRHVKYWVWTGYGIAGFARPLLGITTSWLGVLACRFADRIGKGLRSAPRDAMLAQSVDASQRGLAFGFHRAMDNFGAVIGPLVAAAMLAAGMSLRHVFLWAIVPGVVVIALALFLKDAPQEPAQKPASFSWTLRDFPPAFRRYLIVLALFTLGNSSNMFLLLRARDLGLPQAQVPILWALTSLVAALLSTPLASLSDRLGRTRLIVSGWIVYAIFYLILGMQTDNTWALWPMFASYGLFLAATEGAEKALVADMVPRASSGTAFGWYNLVVGLFLLPASVVFGWLWQLETPLVAFGFGAGCALVAALLLKFWVEPARATAQ